jgi:hypothetical protein
MVDLLEVAGLVAVVASAVDFAVAGSGVAAGVAGSV